MNDILCDCEGCPILEDLECHLTICNLEMRITSRNGIITSGWKKTKPPNNILAFFESMPEVSGLIYQYMIDTTKHEWKRT